MMIIRFSKVLLVVAVSFFCLLTAFGNITDYSANFPAVVKVLTMSDIFPDSTITYRAITSPVLHYVAFIIIVILELLTAIFCGIGAWKLFKARNESASVFNHSKNWAIGGLTLGFVTWQVIFMSIGGEWFGMWMSPTLNSALTTAFHIFITILAVMIYLVIKDE
ncbi:TPA: DUF2165 domain-containing protein [Legionella pneumophila]|uniref:Transmembrane protein n=4 Tax=Legionella pneumophila TaxID=446 RepID=Q5ZT90_LEGPH|nr:DUF2165 domain-containing protein [Legionella pneumophila]OOK39926.1 transmembrane protein [Legionella pneumophila subsp. pneumophila str. Sudbury]AAU28337.1 transmembrane protein [Legionella pneumophila subsp. pneumophila str. Philadelphia 1]AEW52512.1 transmembrane protein [Legionella pneumophila subsp. pneumophila ATCC 43290]AGN15195.1 transmembrane protein [Legionella pneumophila subsp. pneumophila str. Thunder Bay]MCK0181033.1 DUF2165 domain-containing protein [Legionella pneumophila]